MADNPLYGPARPLMQGRGFRKLGGAQVFLKPLGPEVNAWVGLNARSDPGRLSLSPTVGVRHEPVEQWVAVVRGRAPQTSTAPTVQTGMNLLVGSDRVPPWALVKDEDEHNAATWATFGEELDAFVMPWMLERATGEQLVEPLRRGEGLDTSRLALPVLLWLLGDQVGAREALEAGRHLEFRGGLVVDYDAYAERLLAEIDAHPGGPDGDRTA